MHCQAALNVGFLFILGLIGVFALVSISRLPKFTWRGRRYLEDLQTAYRDFKNNVLPKPSQYQPDPAENAAAWNPLMAASFAMPVMAMGLLVPRPCSPLNTNCLRSALLRIPVDLLAAQVAVAAVAAMLEVVVVVTAAEVVAVAAEVVAVVVVNSSDSAGRPSTGDPPRRIPQSPSRWR